MIVIIPDSVDMSSVKVEEGFNPTAFGWEPITAAEFFADQKRTGYVRIETPNRSVMLSAGAFKKTQIPTSVEEEKWEIEYAKKTGFVGRPKA